MSVVKRILGVSSIFTFVILCFSLISPSNVIADRLVWEYVDVGDCRGGKTIDGKKIDIHTTSGFKPDNNVCNTHSAAKIAICWDQKQYTNRYNKEVFCVYKTIGLPCSSGTQPGMRYEKKPYSPGRSIKIYNNTGATLTITVLHVHSVNNPDYRPSYHYIPPNTVETLFNVLKSGENRVERVFNCVDGAAPKEEGIWVSGNQTRRHEIVIYPKDYGKSAMFDRPGCE